MSFRHFRRRLLFVVVLICSPLPGSASDLLEAVKAEDLAGVQAALAAGADANEPDPSTLTPLHMAAARGAMEIATLLIEAGADVAVEAGTGQGKAHALHLAAQFDHPDMVRLLLDHGAAIDAATTRGETALILAAKSGYAGVAEVLLQAGADPLLGDAAYGDTALYIASMHGYLEVVKLMLAKGVDPNLRNPKSGETPLWVAAMDNRVEVIKTLLASGADPNIADDKGKTPVQMTGNSEVVELLRQSGAKD